MNKENAWKLILPEETEAALRTRHKKMKPKDLGAEFGSFEAFAAWAMEHGYEPGMGIQRKNAEAPWSPENCFVTSGGNAPWRREAIRAWNRAVNVLRRHYGLEPFPEERGEPGQENAPEPKAPGESAHLASL